MVLLLKISMKCGIISPTKADAQADDCEGCDMLEVVSWHRTHSVRPTTMAPLHGVGGSSQSYHAESHISTGGTPYFKLWCCSTNRVTSSSAQIHNLWYILQFIVRAVSITSDSSDYIVQLWTYHHTVADYIVLHWTHNHKFRLHCENIKPTVLQLQINYTVQN